MSAVIQNEYTGNGSTTTYSFTFPYLKTSDIKASLDGVETTAFTLPNATTLQFNTAPTNQAKIKIFRQTSVDNLTATFYAGSAIKSEDLNDNFTQNLYKTQEIGGRFISSLGGTMTGNFNLGEDADITFEGASDNANETTITVADPTADRTITFPDVTGTVVTTGDTGTVATGMIAGDAVTGAKIADDQINSEHYVDGSIDTQHIANAQVTTAKIADSNVTTSKLADDAVTAAKLANNAVVTANIVDSAVTANKIATGSVTNTKIANNSISTSYIIDTAVTTAKIADSAITLAKMADDSVGTAELVDGSVDTARLADNSVTLAKMTDNSVGTSEIVNDSVTNAKIADDQIDSEHYVDQSIDTQHIADNAITIAKMADDSVGSSELGDGVIDTVHVGTGQITEPKLAINSVNAGKIVDGTVTTNKIANDAITIGKLGCEQTTISDSDSHIPTSGAVVDYVAAQIAPLGGLEVIATEVAFPNTQPASGVVISISDAGGVVVNGSGVSTTGRTVGGSTVTINGFPASLQSKTMAADIGLMVSSTGSGQVYNYHKILAKEADVEQLSNDINDFAARYRVGSSNPTSSLDNGDLFFNTGTGKMLVYNGTNTAWEEVQSIGNFFISTLSPAFDGSTQNFTLTNAPTNVQQVLLSINGVVQKPNAGSSTPSEGFALDGSTIKLASAPASGSDYFVVVMGSTVNIGTPSNNTVSTAILQNDSVTNAKIAAGAVGSTELAANAVITSKITDSAVTTAKLANTSVTTDKIGNLAVNGNKIANDAVGPDKLANTSVTAGSYGSSSAIPAITVDAQGRITAASTNSITQVGGSTGVAFNDNVAITLGTGSDTFIRHIAGSHTEIDHVGTGDLVLETVNGGDDILLNSNDDVFIQHAGEDMAIFRSDAQVELYHDGTKKFETTSAGILVTGNITTDAISMSDNDELRLGNNDDLVLKHDGTRNLLNANNCDTFISPKSGETAAIFKVNGAVELYYDNAKKLETTSTGINLPGNTDIRLDNGNWTGDATKIQHHNNTLYIQGGSGTYGHIFRDHTEGDRWAILNTGTFFPMTNNAFDIGSAANRVRNIYTNDLHLSNEGSSNDVDSTWGDWTIQEGESDLFLKNNRSGKKYKFNLTEVS